VGRTFQKPRQQEQRLGQATAAAAAAAVAAAAAAAALAMLIGSSLESEGVDRALVWMPKSATVLICFRCQSGSTPGGLKKQSLHLAWSLKVADALIF
jgi:hypothetical protein